MKQGHDDIFTKTGKKYGQYQWAEQTISEWVVEDRVLPLGDGGRGGEPLRNYGKMTTIGDLWRKDIHWTSEERVLILREKGDIRTTTAW